MTAIPRHPPPRVLSPSGGESALASTEAIVEELRNGRMIVLVDAEDRENEGDLIIPAQMATPDAVNFMARYGRGLVCLTLTKARAAELRLTAMVPNNAARNRTAFTVSIEAREGISTGISAHDRARTISTAIDPTRGAADIVSPGHVFPLVARDGGVLVRAGHTEASVDLARLAGLYPASVICEIMNDDGTMARMPDLVPFARAHGLKIGTIEALIGYRLRHDRIVREVARAPVESAFGGGFVLHVYKPTVEEGEHLALVKGDLSAPGPVLVRVHAVDALGDLAGIRPAASGASSGSSAGLIETAMRQIGREGRGVLVLIRDLHPEAISQTLSARFGGGGPGGGGPDNSGPSRALNHRRPIGLGIGAQILRDLGVRDMVLITNQPADTYANVEAFGLHIAGTRGLEP